MRIQSLAVVAVSLLVAALLLVWIGFAKVVETILTVDPLTLTQVVILFLTVLILSSLGLWFLLRLFGNVTYPTYLPLFLASWSVGSFLPGRVGDFTLAFFTKRLKLTPDQLALSVFVDKAITLITIILLGWVSIQQGIITDPFIQHIVAIGTLILFLILVGFFLALTLFQGPLQHIINRFFGPRFGGIIQNIRKDNRRILGGPLHVLGNILITFTRMGVQGLALWLLLTGFGATVSLELTILFLSLSSLSVFVPFTLGGTGVRESLLVILFGLAGVPASIAASAAFTQLIIHYFLVGVFGVYFGRKFKEAWDDGKNPH